MDRKPKRFSSPKRNIYTAIPETEEKVENAKGKKNPQKKKTHEERMDGKKKVENTPAEGSKTSKGISHILELNPKEKEEKEQAGISTPSKLDALSFTADGGDPRLHSFFPSIEKQPLYSMALDREKLKLSEFWPFDEDKPKNYPPPDLKNPDLKYSSPKGSFVEEETNLNHGKVKKKVCPILTPIAEADTAEKKIEKIRRPKVPDSVVLTDERKGKKISPKTSKKRIKRTLSNSSDEAEKSAADHGRIKNLFSILNIHESEENRPVEEKRSVSPIASFLNKLNSTPKVFKSTIFDKANLPGDTLDLFSFPPPKSKDTFKNVIKASKTFIAAGNKSSKNLLKVNKATNVSIKRSKTERKNRPLEQKKDEIKGNYYEINIHEKLDFTPSTIRTAGSSSFNSISNYEHDRISDISSQRPSSADIYKDTPSRHGKRGRKQLIMEHPSSPFKKIITDETKVVSSEQLKSDDKPEKVESGKILASKLDEKSVNEKMELGGNAESSSSGLKKDNAATFRNDNNIGVHMIQQGFSRPPPQNVVHFEENQNSPISRTEDYKIKKHLRELIFYVIFLTLVTLIALSMVSSNMFYFTDITAKLFMDTNSYEIIKDPEKSKPETPVPPNSTKPETSQQSPEKPDESKPPKEPSGEENKPEQVPKEQDEYTTFLEKIKPADEKNGTRILRQNLKEANESKFRAEEKKPGEGNNKPKIQMRRSLRKSVTIADFWLFAESVMIDLFYWRNWFAFENPDSHTEEDDRKFLYENVMLGVPRIRQVRVREDSCHIHPDVSRFFDKCYDYYTIFSENTKHISKEMEGSITESAWAYFSAAELNNSYYWGKISTYGGGGYYLDLSVTEGKTRKMIEELKEKNWISRGTRAVFIDFTIYNANANLFCICKIILEFPPMGGMIPSTDFIAVKLIRYLSNWDYFILGCEFVLIFFIIFYTYQEVIDLKNEKIRYFTLFWNYIDVVILGLAYAYIVLNVLLYLQVSDLLNGIQNRIEEHIPFGSIAYTQTQFNNVIAVLVFFCWIKLFKYLNFNKAMIELSGTLSRSMKDIFGFALMFFTVFIAFAQLAYLLFGNQVKDYSNVWSSSMALLQTLLGEFEYRQIEEANRILGPIFYLVFIFFIFFVLLNMFLAIINDAYIAVKSEVKVHTDQLHVLDYTKRAMLNIIGCCCCGLDKKLESKTSKFKKNTYAEVKEALKKAGYTDLEIEMFFTKYDIDINQLIEKGENKRIIEDLELRRLDFTDEKEMTDIQSLKKEIERLNDRIAEMQRNLIPVIEKVDILLRR